jgi:hypothetical protein
LQDLEDDESDCDPDNFTDSSSDEDNNEDDDEVWPCGGEKGWIFSRVKTKRDFFFLSNNMFESEI